MTEASFDRLVNMLDLPVNHTKSRNSTGGIDPITKDIIVACGLRFLGGETHKSLEDTFHISKSSSKRVVECFVSAVIECDALAIHLPEEEDLDRLARTLSSLFDIRLYFNTKYITMALFYRLLLPFTCSKHLTT